MKLTVNDEEKDLSAPLTLAALIENLGFTGRRIAVELNGEIVPRATWPATSLADGDRIEILQFVGGG